MKITKEALYEEFLLSRILPKASLQEINDIRSVSVKEAINYLNGGEIKYYKTKEKESIKLIKLVSFYQGTLSTIEFININCDLIYINPGKEARLRENMAYSIRDMFPFKEVEEISEADYETVLVSLEKVLNYE